jgi:prophage regulatory protein
MERRSNNFSKAAEECSMSKEKKLALATGALQGDHRPSDAVNRPERLLRFPRVKERCAGLSHSTIYALMAKGQFPKPVSLSGGSGRAVAWKESSIDAWIASRNEAVIEADTTGGEVRCSA